jgi:hypothetical protein
MFMAVPVPLPAALPQYAFQFRDEELEALTIKLKLAPAGTPKT